jgi:lipoate---protein ligase
MKILDWSSPTPAANIACDEALLDECENGGDEVLRFWESSTHFVTLGYTNSVTEEINANECRENNIPILRRSSGGGTVLQGPGCLNYALVLRIENCDDLQNLSRTNAFIMERQRATLSQLLSTHAAVEGYTDLAIQGRKFSGNAQRRKRKALLFHGTFLVDFDLSLIQKYLATPPKQPQYRDARSHLDFVTNIEISRDKLKQALCQTWNANRVLASPPTARIEQLVTEKYTRDEWNLKF